jgi:molecular chaperone GrpE
MADAENQNQESKIDAEKHEAASQAQTPPPQTPPRKPVPVTITDIELEQLKKEASEFKDKYQRALAESENARKRLQREKQEMIQYALQNVFIDFLNPIDHLENALKYADQASEEVKHWALGFQMIANQFKDVLSNHGVITFQCEGNAFDPQRHEAVEMIETTDHKPGTIVKESLRGYKMGDKTIRPAKVTVAKAPSSNENNKTQEKK